MQGHPPPPSPPTAPSPPNTAPPPPRAAAPWLWSALALAVAAVLILALVLAGWAPLRRADTAVATRLHALALSHDGWTRANRVLSDWVWDPWTMRLLLALAVCRLLLTRRRLPAVWCVATAVVGAGLQQGLKVLVDRDRPHWRHPVDSAHYSAMPSGHAMTAAVTCALLLWLLYRTAAGRLLRAAAVVLACLSVGGVSFTRLALGVHWLTDTLVGVALGTALVAAALGLYAVLAGRSAWQERGAPGRIAA